MKCFHRTALLGTLLAFAGMAFASDKAVEVTTVRALDCEFGIPAEYVVFVGENIQFRPKRPQRMSSISISSEKSEPDPEKFKILDDKQMAHLRVREYEFTGASYALPPEDRLFIKIEGPKQVMTLHGVATQFADQIVAECLESVPESVKEAHAQRAAGCKYELSLVPFYEFVWSGTEIALLFADGKTVGMHIRGFSGDSTLKRNGLQPDDVITDFCGVPYSVATTSLESVCCKAGEPDSLLLTVRRGTNTFDLKIHAE